MHNGIIENADELRAKLAVDGAVFVSETDSEVLAHLIAASTADDLEEAVRQALTLGGRHLRHRGPGRRASRTVIVVARNGSPVVLGLGDKEMFVASDVAALVRYTRQVVHLDDGEVATVRADGFRDLHPRRPHHHQEPSTIDTEVASYDAEGYTHFMRKEIHEQPRAVERALSGRLDSRFHTAHLGGLNLDARELREFRRVMILGCGSAYYAGPGRRAAHRGPGPHPGVGRAGLGVPLPQPGGGAGHALRRGQPVRRDLRHPGRGPGAAAQGRPGARAS